MGKTKPTKQVITELLPKLRKFAYAMTGSEADADDLLQGTVERLLQKGVPSDSDAEKWALRVCKNLFIDGYRAAKTRQRNEESMQAGGQGLDTEQVVANRNSLEKVNQAMTTLPEDQRAALTLVVLNGYSYAQVSEVLEMPIGTVMSSISRARRTLATMLTEES